MPISNTTHKILKWLKYIFLSLLGLALIIQICLMLFAEDYLAKKAKEMVAKQSNGLYSLHFDEFNLYIYSRGLSAENVHLKADSTNLNLDVKDTAKSVKAVDLKIEKLRISGVHYWKLLFNNELIINKLLVENPIVVMNTYNQATDTSKQKQILPDLYPMIKKTFDAVEIRNIEFSNGHLTSNNYEKAIPERFDLDQVTVNIKGFRIDSSSSKAVKYAEYMEASVARLSKKTGNSFYTMKVGPVHYQSNSDIINIDSIQLLPRYERYVFAEKKGHEIDRIKISKGSAEIRKFSLIGFLQKNIFKAEKIILSDFSIDVFRDKRLPFPKDKRPKMPQEMIRQMGMELDIDTILLKSWNIAYNEHVEGSEKPGTITFNNLFATIGNITNDSSSLAKDPYMVVNVQANIMDKGKLNLQIKIPVMRANNEFSLTATLGEMPFEALNPMTIHTAFVKVDQGKVNEMHFTMDANDDVATGEVKFLYNNLKVTMVEKGSKDAKELKSFLANLLVIKSDNPSGNTLRIGKRKFERDKSRSIFNYWWKTLLEGLKESLGIKDAKTVEVAKS